MEYTPIPGFETYAINVIGDIRNIKRNCSLKSFLSREKAGYLKVSLFKEGKLITRSVHTLVADTFIPNPLNLPVINHKDRNTLNNFVDNLERCTHAYNIQHGYFFKTLERYSLSYADVLEMHNLKNNRTPFMTLEKLFGIKEPVIKRILNSEIFNTLL